jgi:hypothetical protein
MLYRWRDERACRIDEFVDQDWRELERAFPSFQILVADVGIAEHLLTIRGRFRGRFRNAWRGYQPTGAVVEWPFVDIYEFGDDGLIMNAWLAEDADAVRRALERVDAAVEAQEGPS